MFISLKSVEKFKLFLLLFIESIQISEQNFEKTRWKSLKRKVEFFIEMRMYIWIGCIWVPIRNWRNWILVWYLLLWTNLKKQSLSEDFCLVHPSLKKNWIEARKRIFLRLKREVKHWRVQSKLKTKMKNLRKRMYKIYSPKLKFIVGKNGKF